MQANALMIETAATTPADAKNQASLDASLLAALDGETEASTAALLRAALAALLAAGADVGAVDRVRLTLLHLAAAFAREGVASLLLAAGAVPYLIDDANTAVLAPVFTLALLSIVVSQAVCILPSKLFAARAAQEVAVVGESITRLCCAGLQLR